VSLPHFQAGGRRPDGAALAVAVFLLVVAAVVAYDAFSLQTGAAVYSRIGPRAFPFAVAAALAGLGVATAVSVFGGAPASRDPIAFGPVLWIVGGLVLQMLLIGPLGFSLATGCVFAATARAFGRRSLHISYPFGVALSLAVWLIFAMALKLVLPAGWLEHAALDTIRSLAGWIGG
jgi:putative tricarboxylic transport membrane protein